MKFKRILVGCLLGTILITSLAGCNNSSSDSVADTTEKPTATTNTQAETVKSGTITLYTSQPEADAQKLIAGFNEKYPKINVDLFRSGTEEVVSKVLAEDQVDSVLCDVLLVADSVTFESLKEKDLLLSYKSKELEGIPSEYIDKDNMYTGTKLITTGIIYNTNLVKTPITSFADLTAETLKDCEIMPSPLYSGAAAYNLGVITRYDGLGWDFYKDLKSNSITVEKGNGAVQKAVVDGTKSCGIIVDYMAVRSKLDGAPVEFVYPSEGSPAVTEPIGIMEASKIQDLAKVFVDYVLSTQGQEVASNMGYTPIKAGVSAPEGLKSINNIKSMVADTAELKTCRDKEKSDFSKLFE